MENLIKCSHTLYSSDISDKMKEITSLKSRITALEKELEDNSSPKLFCKNHAEWHSIVGNMLNYIYNNISDLHLIEPGGDGEIITGPGLWMISDKHLKFELLKHRLILVGGTESWASKIASEIFADLKCVLDKLKLHEKYSRTERRDFVYYYIQDKLCERHKLSILANIPQYKCQSCGIIYNDPYDSEDDGEIFEINEFCNDCFNAS